MSIGQSGLNWLDFLNARAINRFIKMNFQVQEKIVFFLNRLFYNLLILLSINLSPDCPGNEH